MKSESKMAASNRLDRIKTIGEIAMVVLPAVLIFSTLSSWAKEGVMRSFIVVWGTYGIMMAMIWIGMKSRGRSWKELGLTFSSVSTAEGFRIFGLSLLVFIAGSAAFLIAPMVASLIADLPPTADFSSYEYLKGNLPGLILSLAGVYIVSSFGEELIFRAFLINRISEISSGSRYNVIIAVLVSSIIFGLIHYKWGLLGMLQTGSMGLVMGISYIKLGKRLWILVLAHAYMDTLLFVQLYLASN